MLLTGIIGQEDNMDTVELINSILLGTDKRMSAISSKDSVDWSLDKLKMYISELSKHNIDVLIIKIDIFDLPKAIFKHLKFDVLIYDVKNNYHDKEINLLCQKIVSENIPLLNEKGMIIVNIDDEELISFLPDVKHRVVTYGFNSKASITTSSIGDSVFKDKFMCCLQKALPAKNGLLVEPQEYVISLDMNEIDPYNILAAASFAIINGIDLNNVSGANQMT